jgi:DNA-binding MarR family transcriptional regulator
LKIRREFSDAAVLARLQERAGYRYQSAQLANYFGVPTAHMSQVLTKLYATNQIRRIKCPCNPTMYYLPTAKELEAEARLEAKIKETPTWTGIVCTVVEGEGI